MEYIMLRLTVKINSNYFSKQHTHHMALVNKSRVVVSEVGTEFLCCAQFTKHYQIDWMRVG